MQRFQQVVTAVNLVALATTAAVYEDMARAAVLVVFVVGVFILTALKVEVPTQIWVIGGVIVGYFFGRVVNFSAVVGKLPDAPSQK